MIIQKYPQGNRKALEEGARGWAKMGAYVRNSFLSTVEDEFRGHPITPLTVVLDAPDGDMRFHWQDFIVSYARANKIAIVNYGITKDARVAVTFKSDRDAVHFRLLWKGWEQIGA
jgi:hypothetical protein